MGRIPSVVLHHEGISHCTSSLVATMRSIAEGRKCNFSLHDGDVSSFEIRCADQLPRNEEHGDDTDDKLSNFRLESEVCKHWNCQIPMNRFSHPPMLARKLRVSSANPPADAG